MAFELESFNDASVDAEYLGYLVDQESLDAAVHFNRLWDYFRNEMSPASGPAGDSLNANTRPYCQAQEVGLPARITGLARTSSGGGEMTDVMRKEVVIENDIAWRIHTMVEFLFGKPITITSRAENYDTARQIERIIAEVLSANGGLSFLQEVSLLGSIYGFVDIVLRTPADWPCPPGQDGQQGAGLPGSNPSLERALKAARSIFLETVEAPRVLPILDSDNYRRTRYWVQRYHRPLPALADEARPWLSFGWAGRRDLQPAESEVVEILSDSWWQRYENRALVAEGANVLGLLPVVHIQNLAMPGTYEGASDVEPLIPLQDELNTRLSDRACRVTYQSFKMYLGKGIDDFLDRPVGPGQMWATNNRDATIEEFGRDEGSPSEDAHIEQIRQALDKVSGVTPLAAGLVRGSVGNLTSATALRVLLSGLVARTQRKRLAYGAGLDQLVRLILTLLDRTGIFRTAPSDREINIHWPDPLEEDQTQRLANARIKLELGVPRQRVLAELGYDPQAVSGGEEVAE